MSVTNSKKQTIVCMNKKTKTKTKTKKNKKTDHMI